VVATAAGFGVSAGAAKTEAAAAMAVLMSKAERFMKNGMVRVVEAGSWENTRRFEKKFIGPRKDQREPGI
jgi:hypothetical protein